MERISALRLAVIFSGFLAISYTLCVLYGLALPDSYRMYPAWQAWLPGFDRIGWSDYVIGLAEVVLYGAYAALGFVLLRRVVAPGGGEA